MSADKITDIYLLQNVSLSPDYKNTFSSKLLGSASSQASFFQGKTGIHITNITPATFQRAKSTIRVDQTFNQVELFNYGMYKNNTKWYYFFVKEVNYINKNTTDIVFEIDVEQTYLFDYSHTNCYIEREHVDDDTIFLHTVEENLAISDYSINNVAKITSLEDYIIIVGVTEIRNAADDYTPSIGTTYGGIFTGLVYYSFDSTPPVSSLKTFLDNYVNEGKADAIQIIFTVPEDAVTSYTDGGIVLGYTSSPTKTYTVTKETSSVAGYIPKNKKLFTHPYNYLYCTNNQGVSAIYKYEDSSASSMEFNYKCDFSPSPTVHLYPVNYKTAGINFDEVMRMAGYPLLNWTNDVFRSWLAQNIISAPLSIASSVLALGVGVATANPIAIAGGAIGVAGTIGTFVEKSIQPAQSKGTSSSAGNITVEQQTFTFYKKTIREEQAIIIDNYFTRFGYKVNVLKTPDITSRSRFNYLKCSDAYVIGNLPRNALDKLISNREKGITFWHVDDIGDYLTANPI